MKMLTSILLEMNGKRICAMKLSFDCVKLVGAEPDRNRPWR
jgi:hypothetical protein